MTALNMSVPMPEIMLAIVGLTLLIAGAVCGNRVTRIIDALAVIAFGVVGTKILCGTHVAGLSFNGMFVDNGFTNFVKVLLLIASGISIVLSANYNKQEKLERFEYPILIVFATLGMMLMVSAADMLALYVGLELQSLALYVLAAFRRDDAKSSEAGLKYFVLGALSSGILLYGISLIYGYAGTTDFHELAIRLQSMQTVPLGVVVGIVFICAALAFKVSAAPFHMWTPDVYEGAPTPVTAFFAAAPKVAALALLTRVLLSPLGGLAHQWGQIIIFAAVASMLIGCFAGLMQKNLKRLMAYSSIANVGFMLVAIAVAGEQGVQALLVYLSIYFLNTLGAFAVILCLRRDGKAVEQISDLSGMGRTNPLVALAMVIFMFSMAGVPPLAGFFGKYFVFLSAVKAGMVPLAIVGVLTSVVSAFYYLRIVKVMYFDEVVEPIAPIESVGLKFVVAATAVFMIGFTMYPAPIIDGALRAARSVVGGL